MIFLVWKIQLGKDSSFQQTFHWLKAFGEYLEWNICSSQTHLVIGDEHLFPPSFLKLLSRKLLQLFTRLQLKLPAYTGCSRREQPIQAPLGLVAVITIFYSLELPKAPVVLVNKLLS
jgi:hypothetical protein